jgi:hypothetical protein
LFHIYAACFFYPIAANLSNNFRKQPQAPAAAGQQGLKKGSKATLLWVAYVRGVQNLNFKG